MKSSKYSFEIKFIIPNYRALQIISWLRINCIPDPEYSKATVSSIYYDSRQLKFLNEKINSDYLKTKIRLRWYSDLTYTSHFKNVFIEAKFKTGSRRYKIRQEAVSVTGRFLSEQKLEGVDLHRFPYLLHDRDYHPPENLFPIFQISYKRHRFIEPFTGSRICFDHDIRCPKINTMIIKKIDPTPIKTAVFEIKGKEEELPATLYPLTDFGCKKDSFSKYSACYRHLMKINY